MEPLKNDDIITWYDPIIGAKGKFIKNRVTRMTVSELLKSPFSVTAKADIKKRIGREPTNQEIVEEIVYTNWAEVDKV